MEHVKEKRNFKMHWKKLYYNRFIIMVFICLLSATYANASIQQVVLKDMRIRNETILGNKIEKINLYIFNEENIIFQFQNIDSLDNYYNKKLRIEDIAYAMNQIRRRPFSNQYKWDHQWSIELKDKNFNIYINRDNETVTIQGNVNFREEKQEIENIIKVRAPSNYKIINIIDICNNKQIG